jgi:DNA-binding transcriptional MerR regulator
MENEKLLTPRELAALTGLRKSTINFWSDIGLLKYKQGGPRLMRRYPEKENLERVEKIRELKNKRLTIPEIIEAMNKD